jgi:hypothetical protein
MCCVFVLFFPVLCDLCYHFWLSIRYSLMFICQFLWIVHFWLSLRYSLTFICQFLWIVHFWLPLRYSLTFICQVLWIVQFRLSLLYSLTFILKLVDSDFHLISNRSSFILRSDISDLCIASYNAEIGSCNWQAKRVLIS